MVLWKDTKTITEIHLSSIQCVVDKFVTPADIGQIPYKISSGFSAFTVDQWKNWTLVYSLVALKDILTDEHYRCWHTFEQACNIMCSRAILKAGVSLMDHHLMSFCNQVEQWFGVGGCTPNLHMHGMLL